MYPNSTHRFFGEIFVFGFKTGIDSIPEKRQKKKRDVLCILHISTGNTLMIK